MGVWRRVAVRTRRRFEDLGLDHRGGAAHSKSLKGANGIGV
jgi:hypothetical protein